jgi:hypothetical protein
MARAKPKDKTKEGGVAAEPGTVVYLHSTHPLLYADPGAVD